MTCRLEKMMQPCFTYLMREDASKSGSETIRVKAQRLLVDPSRLLTYAAVGNEYWVGAITGDHGRYAAYSVAPEHAPKHDVEGARIGCGCKAGRRGRTCSHALAAEEMRKRGV